MISFKKFIETKNFLFKRIDINEYQEKKEHEIPFIKSEIKSIANFCDKYKIQYRIIHLQKMKSDAMVYTIILIIGKDLYFINSLEDEYFLIRPEIKYIGNYANDTPYICDQLEGVFQFFLYNFNKSNLQYKSVDTELGFF